MAETHIRRQIFEQLPASALVLVAHRWCRGGRTERSLNTVNLVHVMRYFMRLAPAKSNEIRHHLILADVELAVCQQTINLFVGKPTIGHPVRWPLFSGGLRPGHETILGMRLFRENFLYTKVAAETHTGGIPNLQGHEPTFLQRGTCSTGPDLATGLALYLL